MRRRVRKNKAFSRVWIYLILLLILFSLLSFFVFQFYFKTLEKKESQFVESRSQILSEKLLKNIKSIEAFHELESYHIFFGLDKDDEDLIVFLPMESEELETIIVKEEDIISKEELQERLLKECSSCHKISIKPAMMNEEPLWEITYFDQHERYNMDYFSMLNGKRYERLQLKQTFK